MPLPGDEIIGYISRGRGIVVHKKDCENILNGTINEERLTPVAWSDKKVFRMPVAVKTVVIDRPGILFDIATIMKEMGINISNMSSNKIQDGLSRQDFVIEVKDKKELKTVVNKLMNIDGVQEVRENQ
jgi:GTP pyrophosphokinase